MKKKILIIPHVLNHPVRVRGVALAEALAQRGHRVHLMSEFKLKKRTSFFGKILFHLKNLNFNKVKLSDNLTEVYSPRVQLQHPTLPRKIALLGLKKLIKKEKYDIVINGQPGKETLIGKDKTFRYILDVVDNHWDGYRKSDRPEIAKNIESHYNEEFTHADTTVVVSSVLQEIILKRWKTKSKIIPNGVDTHSFRGPHSPPHSHSFKKTGFLFGYIGGMDSYLQVDLINEAFDKVKAQHPLSQLIWIGAGSEYDRLNKNRAMWENKNIFPLGPVPTTKAAQWISLFDVGLIPKACNDFTHSMMPIKSVEYGAARKAVLSTPLLELKALAFPNISLVPETVDEWSSAMLKSIEKPLHWSPEWDHIFNRYDWDRIGESFEKLF